jgi:hypothetical protein
MNRDDIIRMAREAGLHLYVNDLTEEPYALIVERFAELVAAAEREACAQMAGNYAAANAESDNMAWAFLHLATAIRARG